MEALHAQLKWQQQLYQFRWDQPLDLSIPLQPNAMAPNCFYAPFVQADPVIAGDFIGSTAKGGPVNFFTVKINPHGNGTHTECVGHISQTPYTLNQCLKQFAFIAVVCTAHPTLTDSGDRVVLDQVLQEAWKDYQHLNPQALVLRTLPNRPDKKMRQYSGTNPPYLEARAAQRLVDQGIDHLLLDLPSVDREEDGGALQAHKAFWQYPEQPRTHATISELIYVPNHVPDGLYLLHFQITSLELDASPSKPVLYALNKM